MPPFTKPRRDIISIIYINGSWVSLQKINCKNALEMAQKEGSPSTEKTQKDESTGEVINHPSEDRLPVAKGQPILSPGLSAFHPYLVSPKCHLHNLPYP